MKQKISTRILLSMLAVALVPLVTIFLYITSRYSQDLKRSTLEQKEAAQQSSVNELVDYLTKIEFISNICFDPNVQQIIRQEASDTLQRYNNQNQIERNIRVSLDLFDILETVDLVSISNTKGVTYNIGQAQWAPYAQQVIQRQKDTLAAAYKLQELAAMEWYLPGQAPVKDKLIYTRSINDISVTEKNIGTIWIVFDKAQFGRLLAKYSEAEGSAVAVRDKTGRLLYTNFEGAADELAQLEAGAEELWGAKRSVGTIKAAYPASSLGLTVTFYDDLAVVLAPLTALRRITLCVIGGTVVLIFALAMFLSRGLVRPIRQLQKGVDKVREGDFAIHLPVQSRDELGALCNAFNLMAEKIDFLVNEVYATQLSEKEAVIASLTSQINPHFLYNTLDMVKSMADLEDVEEIGEIAKALSGLFRYSTRNDRLLVPVREELENLNNYIRILQARFGGKICFEIDAAPDILSCEIIKVCLQPLIENSVSHGLVQKGGRGRIFIRIRRREGLLEIVEEDDGAGMDDATLARVQALLRQEAGLQAGAARPPANGPHGGVGLQNINQRIRLYYGPEYGILLSSEPGKGTRVTITVPAIEV